MSKASDKLMAWLSFNKECGDAALYDGMDAMEAWKNAKPKHLVWAATRPGVLDDDTLRRFARWCASQALHLWDAPPIVRQYLETGDESIRAAARAAAWDAAWDASWDASGDAARAAAWDAAWDASWDASGDAAWAAAWDAAWAASVAAAWAAAGDAAWAAQAKWLRDNAKPNWSVVDQFKS